MRIGFGQYDRCFKKDSSFYLGGILFSANDENNPVDPNDLLIDSIADALLGAAGLGGLYNYPDKNKINNPEILSDIEKEIHYRGLAIENIDITIMVLDQMLVEKQSDIHSKVIMWLFIKPEQLNIKFIFNSNVAETKDYIIQITAIALLNARS